MGKLSLALFTAALLCYLIGSVNLAVIVSKKLFGQDVRACGSKNAGSTNMLRTFGIKAALPVFLGDMAKGALSVWLAGHICAWFGTEFYAAGYIGGFFSLLGQMYPVYFGFHGGKGVATALGVIMALHPIGGTAVVVCGFVIAALTGYVSMGSVLCALAYSPLAFCMGGMKEFVFALPMALLVLYGHRENIRRLLRHEENRFTPPKKPQN